MPKRDAALIPLSHDHHQALFLAQRMRRATGTGVAEVVADALEYWRGHGADHFRIEEDLLLPALARHIPADDERIVRVLVDHVWIRERFERLEAGTRPDGLGELGQRLDDHVRHEERVVFPLIEAELGSDELAALGARVEAAEAD